MRSNTAGFYEETHGIGHVASAIVDGRITDDAVRTGLAARLEGLIEYVRTLKEG